MNFTREPIIETVITPRDGCKLVVRSSKNINQEDYVVDAIEVVSFGHSFFFRSSERPKSFLVPVSDYELVELKEVRMPLKNMGADRSIKIGGGRETVVKPSRDTEESGLESAPEIDEVPMAAAPLERSDKKQGRRRSRRRRGTASEMKAESAQMSDENELEESVSEKRHTPPATGEERAEEVAPSFISKLFPPPPTLIKETLSRYKTSEEGIVVESAPSVPEDLFEHPTPESKFSEVDEETRFE